MNFETETIDGISVIRLSGRYDAGTTGTLADRLVARVRTGCRAMLVDCAPGTVIARPVVRGLVVAATLMRSTSGGLRIVADRALEAWLREVGFNNLFAIDRSRSVALAKLGLTAPVAANTPEEPTLPETLRTAALI